MTPQPPRRTGFFEHYEELIGTWTRRLRNRQQAEDLAHDTFVRVLESAACEVAQPRAYLHQTARNIAVDAYRREDRREALALQGVDHSTPHSGDPEHYMHAIQLADAIERALAHKDSDQVRAAYHRGAHWKERVAMAQWWSDHLDALRDGATVLPFRAGER